MLTRSLGRVPEVELPARRRIWAKTTKQSPLATVTALVVLGLATQMIGYTFGYAGDSPTAVTWLFFAGLVLIYLPCAAVLLAKTTVAGERRYVVVLLGLGLLASTIVESPLVVNGFDPLLHETTLWQLPYFHRLFTNNTVLPVSPYYPGLELVTLGVKLLTGLPSLAAEDVTVALARLALVVVLYLFIARATRSERAGGIGVLVYAASPQFYGFNAAYSYQTLALAFGAGAVYFLFLAIDQAEPQRRDRHVQLALLCLACLVITHHLVAWLTLVLLVGWTIAVRCQEGGRERARILTRVTLLGLAMGIIWTAVASRKVLPYLAPILSEAWTGLIGIISGHGARRHLFEAGAVSTPLIQEVLVVVSVLITGVLLLFALWAVLFRGVMRGGPQRFIPLVLAAAYPLDLLSALSPTSAEVGQRASTFVFLGIAVVIAAWLAWSASWIGPRVGAAIATICFLGTVILGSGPIWSDVPGSFLPAGDSRSVDAPSLAAAEWAAANLPVNSTIAADRDNQVLMAAIAHLRPVTALGGLVNVGPIYFDPVFGAYDRSLVVQAQIRYLLVDDRLTSGPPTFGGAYFEPGETTGPERLTAADLRKFSVDPQFRRIYDNGPIQIYDLSAIDGKPAPRAGPSPSGLASSAGNGKMEIAFLIVAAGALVARRRRGSIGLEGLVVLAFVGLGVLILFALLVVYAHIGIGPASGIALALAAVGFVAAPWGGRRRAQSADPLVPGPETRRRASMFAVVSILVALCALWVETSVQKSWMHPPASVSVSQHGVNTVVSVAMGSNPAPSSLRVTSSTGTVLWTKTLPSRTLSRVALPPGVSATGDKVQLTITGQPGLTVNA